MTKVQRTYLPGSEWLYLKIYAGNKTVDNLLIHDIPLIINRVKKESLIEKWFFIRYSDPAFHLRIRFLLKEKQNFGRIIEIVNSRLNKQVKSNLVWKIQVDTYNRELERYGHDLVEDGESIFCFDSECILSILEKLNNNEDYRWMIGLKMIDALLSDASLDLKRKMELLTHLSQSFRTEFGFNEFNAKQLNSKFRSHKQVVESVLNNQLNEDGFLELCKPLSKRSKMNKQTIRQIENKIKNEKKQIRIESLLDSYIHMMMNRLFMSKNRMHELIMYDCLSRYYTSEIAKLNMKNKPFSASISSD